MTLMMNEWLDDEIYLCDYNCNKDDKNILLILCSLLAQQKGIIEQHS